MSEKWPMALSFVNSPSFVNLPSLLTRRQPSREPRDETRRDERGDELLTRKMLLQTGETRRERRERETRRERRERGTRRERRDERGEKPSRRSRRVIMKTDCKTVPICLSVAS